MKRTQPDEQPQTPGGSSAHHDAHDHNSGNDTGDGGTNSDVTANAKQRVELFKIVTAGDFDDMKQFGAYIFYRVGITPAGQWTFFVAGD